MEKDASSENRIGKRNNPSRPIYWYIFGSVEDTKRVTVLMCILNLDFHDRKVEHPTMGRLSSSTVYVCV